MKFYCDSCQAKYSIPDEKVRGKVLKVRCKKCSHIITVRDPGAPGASAGASSAPTGGAAPGAAAGGAAAPPPPKQSIQWHYSVNGQTFGPLSEDELVEKFSSGELGDATYVWNETFTDWKPAGAVEVFAEALQTGETRRPKRNTMGVSQALEAVEQPQQQQGASAAAGRDDSAPKERESVGQPAESDEPSPRSERKPDEPVEGPEESDVTDTSETSDVSEVADSPTPEVGRKESRKSRLDNLRQRLSLGGGDGDDQSEQPDEVDSAQPRTAAAEDADPAISDGGEPAADGSEQRELRQQDDKREGGLNALRAKLGGTGESEKSATVPADGVDDGEPVGVAADEPADEFDGIDEDSTPVEDEPTPIPAVESSEHDGMFAGVDGDSSPEPSPTPEADAPQTSEPAQDDGEPAEDAVPFFPSAPKLGDSDDESDKSTSMSRVGEMTDSLLIQINEIKGDGRKRAVYGTIGLLVALVALGAVGYLAWGQLGAEEEVIEQDDGPRVAGVGQRPEFRGYTEEELARVSERFVVEEEIEITREDSQAAYERDQAAGGTAESPSAEDSEAGGQRELPSIDSDPFGDAREDSGAEPGVEPGAGAPRFARAGDDDDPDGLSDRELAQIGQDHDGDPSQFDAMAAIQSDRQRGIYDGDENINLDELELQEGLTQRQMSRGLDRVIDSVGSCRERHIMRGGSLDANSIEMTLTVVPEGEVAQFSMEPASLNDTDFERCMNSQQRRWRFPRFKGDPVKIVQSFALQ